MKNKAKLCPKSIKVCREGKRVPINLRKVTKKAIRDTNKSYPY